MPLSIPPTIAFEQPARVLRALDTKNISIADLMAIPAAWAVVIEQIPNVPTNTATNADAVAVAVAAATLQALYNPGKAVILGPPGMEQTIYLSFSLFKVIGF